jgi:hypothetical protein
LKARISAAFLVEGPHLVGVHGVVEREHRHPVGHLGEALRRGGAHPLGRGIGAPQLGMGLFQLQQLAEQPVVVGVGDLRAVLEVIQPIVTLDLLHQGVDPAPGIRLRLRGQARVPAGKLPLKVVLRRGDECFGPRRPESATRNVHHGSTQRRGRG